MSEGLTIAQLSDLHCGSPSFVPSLLDRAIAEVNEIAPDVVVISGDLTGDGFRGEYEQAREYLDKIDCERTDRDPGEPRLAERRATCTSRSCSASAARSCT